MPVLLAPYDAATGSVEIVVNKVGKGLRLREQRQEQRQVVLDARNVEMRRRATEEADVMLRCPVTDKFFPTGVVGYPGGFNSLTMADMTTNCPSLRSDAPLR